MWDFQIQPDRQVITNQPDVVVVDKLQKKAAVIDVARSMRSLQNTMGWRGKLKDAPRPPA